MHLNIDTREHTHKTLSSVCLGSLLQRNQKQLAFRPTRFCSPLVCSYSCEFAKLLHLTLTRANRKSQMIDFVWRRIPRSQAVLRINIFGPHWRWWSEHYSQFSYCLLYPRFLCEHRLWSGWSCGIDSIPCLRDKETESWMGLEGAWESCNWYVPGLSWETELSTHKFVSGCEELSWWVECLPGMWKSWTQSPTIQMKIIKTTFFLLYILSVQLKLSYRHSGCSIFTTLIIILWFRDLLFPFDRRGSWGLH